LNEDNQVAAATSADEIELELTQDDTEDADALRQKLAAAEEAKRQLHARAKRAEAALRAAKPEPSPLSAAPSADDEYTELRLDGYSKDDALFIKRNGGRKALEDANSLVAIAIRAKREQKEAESAASQVSPNSGASEIERRYTPEQLDAMSVEELQKILPRA
jgi:hypothetical protein